MTGPYTADAEFTPSTFGGGWLKANNEAGKNLVMRVLGEEGDPPWPEGWLVEPYQMCELVEWAEVMGVALEGTA
jgi:hypothetical protein